MIKTILNDKRFRDNVWPFVFAAVTGIGAGMWFIKSIGPKPISWPNLVLLGVTDLIVGVAVYILALWSNGCLEKK